MFLLYQSYIPINANLYYHLLYILRGSGDRFCFPASRKLRPDGLFFLAVRQSKQACFALTRCVSFGPTSARVSASPSLSGTHYGRERLCGTEVRKAVSRRLATVGGLQGLTRSKSVSPPRTFGEQCDLWSPRLNAGDYQTVRSQYMGQKSGWSCQP